MEAEVIAVEAKKFGIEPKKETELMGNLPQIQSERLVFTSQYDEVIKMDLEDYNTRALARELRLKIRDNRTKGIVVWHKNTKEVFLKGGQFIDAIKNREVAINESMEKKLEDIEKHYENLEKARIQKLQDERIAEVSKYMESTEALSLGEMDEDFWQAYLTSKKKIHKDKIKAEKEVERLKVIEDKRIEEERSKQLIENARLKAEAVVREKALIAEREANAKILAEETKKRETIAEEARLKLKTETEARIKAENIIKAKQEEDRIAKATQESHKKAVQDEADRLEKAPDKDRLVKMLDDTNLIISSFNFKTKEAEQCETLIIDKFNGFKKWAKLEIEKL